MNYFNISVLVFVWGFSVISAKSINRTDSSVNITSDLKEDRNGITNTNAYWPGGVVPVRFADGQFNADEITIIETALGEIIRKTCIKFRDVQPSDTSYVTITSTDIGCYSTSIGKASSPQVINLNRSECVTPYLVIHEMLHALGFFHQQSTYNRDEYVQINWDNIINDKYNNFDIFKDTTDFGVGYEYGSIMHYPWNAFAIQSDIPTIIPTNPGVTLGGTVFTDMDVLKLRRMYRCGS